MANTRKMINVTEVQFRRYQVPMLGTPEAQVKKKERKKWINTDGKKKCPERRKHVSIFLKRSVKHSTQDTHPDMTF